MILLMKQTSKLPFPTWRKHERTRKHSDGLKNKLQKRQIYIY